MSFVPVKTQVLFAVNEEPATVSAVQKRIARLSNGSLLPTPASVSSALQALADEDIVTLASDSPAAYVLGPNGGHARNSLKATLQSLGF